MIGKDRLKEVLSAVVDPSSKAVQDPVEFGSFTVEEMAVAIMGIRDKKGDPVYAGLLPDDLRFMAANKIFCESRDSLETKKGCEDSFSYVTTKAGEVLGFVDLIASTDEVDSDGQYYRKPDIQMTQHTMAYKAQKYGHKMFDKQHDGEGRSDIFALESSPIVIKKDGKDINAWRLLLYLDSEEDRRNISKINGLSVTTRTIWRT